MSRVVYTIECIPKNLIVDKDLRTLADVVVTVNGRYRCSFSTKQEAIKAEDLLVKSESKIYKGGLLWTPPTKGYDTNEAYP